MMKKYFKNILIKKGKKNGISILICAVILTISLGTLAGCSIAEENTEDISDSSESEHIPFEQIAGKWRIDFNMTTNMWGSGISYGDKMEISTTGEFNYYIGITDGGTGQCEDKNGEITVEIEPYERHSSENEILTLKYVNDKEEEYILMNWHDNDVYWKRENILPTDNNTLGNIYRLLGF